jgi:hypothetical protein
MVAKRSRESSACSGNPAGDLAFQVVVEVRVPWNGTGGSVGSIEEGVSPDFRSPRFWRCFRAGLGLWGNFRTRGWSRFCESVGSLVQWASWSA